MTGKITGFVYFALVFVLSILLLIITLSPSRWADVCANLNSYWLELMLGSIAMAFVSVLFFQTSLITRRSKDYFSVSNEGGSTNISTDAICAYIEKVSAGMPAVVRMKARVVPASGGMNIMIDLKMKAIPQMQDMCDTLQKTIRDNLATGLGIRQVGKIEVIVKDIVEA